MSHIEDRWRSPGRRGNGLRWRVRYLNPDGRERSKSFARKVDAENFQKQVDADLLRGTYLDPDAGPDDAPRRMRASGRRAGTPTPPAARRSAATWRNHILPGARRPHARAAGRPADAHPAVAVRADAGPRRGRAGVHHAVGGAVRRRR